MTNPIALTLGLMILVAIAVDVLVFDTEYLLFLSRKMFQLIEWMAFWR